MNGPTGTPTERGTGRVVELIVTASVAGIALGRAGDMLATSSRDWGADRGDAWLWGLLCGWDCEDHPDGNHDDLCADGAAMDMVAALHNWTPHDVARLREYRTAIRSLRELTATQPPPRNYR